MERNKEQNRKQTHDFTRGPIFGPLVRFALPVLAALFLQTMYGAVDLLVVGQFGGPRAQEYVSAVSTGGMLMQTLTIVISGLAMGLTVSVALRIGAGRKDEAGQIIGCGIWLFGVIALVLTAVMLLSSPALASLMQVPEKAVPHTVAYLRICSGGLLFIIAYNLLGSVFRGIGDSVIPLISVVIACVMNIAGDLLLVAVFHLGAVGAAAATVAAQAFSVVFSLQIIRRRELPFVLTRSEIRPQLTLAARILRTGIPVALQDLLVSISFLVILSIVNHLGLTASAGVGVAEKLCGFLMLVPSAYMQSMSSFVAQNIGAGRQDRADRALFCGIASSLAVCSLMWYCTFFHGDLLSGLFARDPEIIAVSAEYLKAYAIDCLLTSFLFCFIGYFNGCARTTFVMLQGIAGAFGVRIPVSYYMSRQVPVSLFHMGLATPASSLVQILLCGAYFLLLRRSRKAGNPGGGDAGGGDAGGQ